MRNFLSALVIVNIIKVVLTNVCVTYDFEENYDTLFDNSRVCEDLPLWSIGYYNETDVEPPHERSTRYIYPSTTMSCSSSFNFTVNTDGVFEVNVEMQSTNTQDQIIILVQGINEGSNDVVIGQGSLLSTDGTLVSTNGIYTIPVTWTTTGEYTAYVAFMGIADEESVVLLDSFRYIPPAETSDTCVVYSDDEDTTTAAPDDGSTTTIGTDNTDDDDTTTANPTTEPTTDDPGTTTEEPETTEDPETTQTTTTAPTDTTTEAATTTNEPETTELTTENPQTDSTDTTTDAPETNTDLPETENTGTTNLPETTQAIDATTDSTDVTTDSTDETTEGAGDNVVIITQGSSDNAFWTTVSIVTISLLCLIVFCLVCWCFYECGRRKGRTDIPPELNYEEYDDLPKPYTVPRVTKVYVDSPFEKTIDRTRY